jgi:dihydrofolate reductase
MTLDGFCDHTSMIADAELHDHYTNLLRNAGCILYGRTTYGLMEYWRTVLKNPTGKKSFDEFAVAIDAIPKIVFSHTLKEVDWESARISEKGLKEELAELRQKEDKDILIGSRSLIVSLLNLKMIDEMQLCVQPILASKGLSLFENLNERIDLKLDKTKIFKNSGSVVFYYRLATDELQAGS